LSNRRHPNAGRVASLVVRGYDTGNCDSGGHGVHDRRLERNALLLLWSTLRNNLQPELTSPLARDKAKRSDAALLRLIAGYDHLAALRARCEPG
jgi:hypothetical protein